jgi:hypothetical protein
MYIDFLCNVNEYEFGTNQMRSRVNNVELPPWAHGSPRRFIQIHRYAYTVIYIAYI